MPQHSHRYILLVSVHGLVRGSDMELGRDADTGGQVKYVVELARALIEHPGVEKVDLVTRRVPDSRVDAGYAKPVEVLQPGVNIIRIPCGPNRYVAKESLWPYLDSFVDNTLQYLRSQGRPPDLVHGHYADAGYVASCLSGVMNIPMAFTGHSLGRVKRERLLEKGSKPESIEKRYRISRRIEAEENALDHAALVVASTSQEVEEQYCAIRLLSTATDARHPAGRGSQPILAAGPNLAPATSHFGYGENVSRQLAKAHDPRPIPARSEEEHRDLAQGIR